jgi:hypothetical protein
VLVAICVDPFQPACIERLPAQYWGTVMHAAVHSSTIHLTLDHPVFAYLRARILADRQCLDRSLLTLCVNHIAERDLLAGDFAGAQALLEAFADLDVSLVRGMLELVQGRVPEARQAFDLSLRNSGKSKTAQMEHLGTLPGVLHALLLVQSDQPKDRQQVRTWVDWFDRQRGAETYYDAYRILGALLAFYEGREPQDDAVWSPLLSRNAPLAQFSTCLAQLLYRLYTSQPRASKRHKDEQDLAMEEFLRVCQAQGARWPFMQLARLRHKLGVSPAPDAAGVEAFFKDTPARDLSDLWAIKEVWETRIGALEQLLQEAQHTTDAPAAAAVRRLGWKLYEAQPEEIVVTPVEQKRTKSGGWTKGREVPVQRLINHQAE